MNGNQIFNAMMQSMEDILLGCGRQECEAALWINVIELVNLTQMPDEAKNDVFGCVAGWLTGETDHMADFWTSSKEGHPDHLAYLEAKARYLIDDAWFTMGTKWSDLVREGDWTRLQQVLEWLWLFRTEVFPGVEDIISGCEQAWKSDLGLSDESILKRQKRFSGVKSTHRRSYELLDRASDVIILQQTPR